MRIVMFTNTYLPHVGGVARSVSTTADELRRRGAHVGIVAPQFENATESTDDVLRVPAIQNFSGSDFSVRIPQPAVIGDFLDRFAPDVLHSHHPFLLGDAALRAAWSRRLPLVFTHHTLYEHYARYVPHASEAMRRVVIQMTTEYARLCTHVIAPSDSIRAVLVERGVMTPVSSLPTGIDVDFFGGGDGEAFRARHSIEDSTFVVGHVGRLAPEKNLEYLARAVRTCLAQRPDARFVVVGDGEHRERLAELLTDTAAPSQVLMTGTLTGADFADAYAAMDVFAFSSQCETQGMVVAEALAAGTPVVALEGPGVREVVNESNGALLPAGTMEREFAATLLEFAPGSPRQTRAAAGARRSVRACDTASCGNRLVELYATVLREYRSESEPAVDAWDRLLGRLEIEWGLLVEKMSALSAALVETPATRVQTSYPRN